MSSPTARRRLEAFNAFGSGIRCKSAWMDVTISAGDCPESIAWTCAMRSPVNCASSSAGERGRHGTSGRSVVASLRACSALSGSGRISNFRPTPNVEASMTATGRGNSSTQNTPSRCLSARVKNVLRRVRSAESVATLKSVANAADLKNPPLYHGVYYFIHSSG